MTQDSAKAQARKGSASARNRMARLLAVQAVYQLLMTDLDVNTVLLNVRGRDGFRDEGTADPFVDHDDQLFLSIVRHYAERKDDIDGFMTEAVGAKFKDMEVLLKSVLMCGAAEILCHTDVDGPIIINDYITVTESFFQGTEKKIVNAVLDKLLKQVR